MIILIIEDEPIIARRIKRLLNQLIGDQVDEILIAHGVESGLEILGKTTIDLLFLDLNLNGEDGFRVLETFVAYAFHTIIISAYREKAIEAFEYGVLDFVPKPFNAERLRKALQRLDATPAINQPTAKYLSIQKRGKVQLLAIADLSYVKGAGVYSELYFQNGQKELHNKNLEKLTQLLPAHFERIHKSYITNLQEVSDLKAQPGSKYSLFLKDGTELPIGRTKYKALKAKWTI